MTLKISRESHTIKHCKGYLRDVDVTDMTYNYVLYSLPKDTNNNALKRLLDRQAILSEFLIEQDSSVLKLHL